jgi:hypothetical protein
VSTQKKENPLSREQSLALATEAHMRNAAHRLADDPLILARSARIVRAAIETGKLTPADLDGPVVQP